MSDAATIGVAAIAIIPTTIAAIYAGKAAKLSAQAAMHAAAAAVASTQNGEKIDKLETQVNSNQERLEQKFEEKGIALGVKQEVDRVSGLRQEK